MHSDSINIKGFAKQLEQEILEQYKKGLSQPTDIYSEVFQQNPTNNNNPPKQVPTGWGRTVK